MLEHYPTRKEARTGILFTDVSKGHYPQERDSVRKGSRKAEHERFVQVDQGTIHLKTLR